MKLQWKLLAACIAVPLAAGAAAGLLSAGGMTAFREVEQPPLSPPSWLFPVAWTLLYTLMGISSYLIIRSNTIPEETMKALTVYAIQLTVNFLWPIFFFGFQWYGFSFLWLLLLLGLVAGMIRIFSRMSKTAAYLNLPYFLWLVFAAYLNFGVWRLNM